MIEEQIIKIGLVGGPKSGKTCLRTLLRGS